MKDFKHIFFVLKDNNYYFPGKKFKSFKSINKYIKKKKLKVKEIRNPL